MLRRLYGLVLRHLYLLMGSWPRVVEMVYWPALNLLVWGYLNFYLTKEVTGVGLVGTTILGGAMLWEFMTRSQVGVLVSFLEETWARNVGNLFVTPMSPLEYSFGLIVLSVLRVAFAMTGCLIMMALLFDFWLPGIGWAFYGFALNLAMTGWALCFVIIGLLLRFGMAVEWLAWMASFALSPLVGVYYPVTILPAWLQHVSWVLPPTYVFEGMRALLKNHEWRPETLATAFGLNLIYLAAGLATFYWCYEKTRRTKGLLQAED